MIEVTPEAMGVYLDRNGQSRLVFLSDGRVTCRDLTQGSEVFELPVSEISDMLLIPQIGALVTTSETALQVWDIDDGSLVNHVRTVPISGLCSFLVDGKQWLATAGDSLIIWDLETLSEVHRIPNPHDGYVFQIVEYRTRDGLPRCASSGSDATVRLWDPITGSVADPLTRNIDEATHLASWQSPTDGSLLVTAQGSLASIGTAVLTVWDPDTGQPVATHQLSDGWYSDVTSFTDADRRCRIIAGIEESCGEFLDISIVDQELTVRTAAPSVGAANTVALWPQPDSDLRVITAGALGPGPAVVSVVRL